MPLLVYPSGDFQPFTKILSAEVNGKFTAITTLLNTTKLNYLNLQTGALLYASQLSTQVIITDSTGLMTTSPSLSVSRGGLGFTFSPVLADANKVLQVNVTGTALTFDAAPANTGGKIYNTYRFG